MPIHAPPRTAPAADGPAATPHRPGRRTGLAGFAAANAIAAWAGAIGLVSGALDFGEGIDQRLPFDSKMLAGVALAVGVAVPLTALARAAWTRSARTDQLALLTGLMLIGWIAVQVLVLQAFSIFQPVYLAVGAVFVAASHRLRLGPRSKAVLFVTTGAILLAVGVGLVPHLLDPQVTLTAATAVAMLIGGFALTFTGARSAWRDQSILGRFTTVAGTVVLVALAVSVVAPGIAATHVAPTEITSTPTSVGLDHESVILPTSDGVELAAWYIGGTNGAGLVVMHGAGSTRSDVLEQSAALATDGYSLLLIDARGHGDSAGTAMDFGWCGDLDIAAGTAYLASRPEIDPDRIGVVGFSMGAEEAIGAAANNSAIRVVVAEGATARRAADKEWLSDEYGWRGWVQERIEYLQQAVTDYLTEASPPTRLRSAVAAAGDTQFLLITAGTVDDESHAAAFIAADAPDRVTIWNVDGADHTGGYTTAPDEWRRHVLEFLDDHLC